MMGDGAVVTPEDGVVVAPEDGTVLFVLIQSMLWDLQPTQELV